LVPPSPEVDAAVATPPEVGAAAVAGPSTDVDAGLPFSRDEESKVVDYIVQNGHAMEVNGNSLWKLIR
jgi:hypothetical protein